MLLPSRKKPGSKQRFHVPSTDLGKRRDIFFFCLRNRLDISISFRAAKGAKVLNNAAPTVANDANREIIISNKPYERWRWV